MLQLSRQQLDRLANGSIFFARASEHCGFAKLCRLLYLLDVRHFQETGVSVTGERYCAWSFGPAPEMLFGCLERTDSPIRTWFAFEADPSIDFFGFRLIPKCPVSLDNFTPRQIDLMQEISRRHHADHYGDIEFDGIDLDAYRRTWAQGSGKGLVIPYEATVARDNPFRAMVLERYREDILHRKAMIELLGDAGRHAA